MALLEDVSLKLLFEAENNASSTIEALVSGLGDLSGVLKDLQDLNPFAPLTDSVDGLTGSLDTLAEAVDRVRTALGQEGTAAQTALDDTAAAAKEATTQVEAAGAAGQAMGDAIEAGAKAATAALSPLSGDLTDLQQAAVRMASIMAESYQSMSAEIKTAMQTVASETADAASGFSDWDTALQDAAQAAQDVADQMGAVQGAVATSADDVTTFNERLQQSVELAQELATATKDTTLGVLGTSETTAIPTAGESSSGHGSLGSTLLMGGMNAMMGYYGLQMLGNSAMNFSYIEQMQKLNNSTPQEAAQMMAMLGMGGMTGSSGVSFLSGLEGQLKQTFTPQVGTGMLSQQAILLESLGITQQSLAQSPAMLLNTIAQRYQGFEKHGQGQNAAELLSLTGTSQLATLFQNWQTAQKQTQGLLPGMTSHQVANAAKEGLSMQASLMKLSLAFSQLATTLVPLISPLVQGFSSVMKYFTSGGTELQRLAKLVSGVAAAFAAINLGKLLFGKVVPTMTVEAGVVNVTGGVGSAASAGETAGAGAAGAEGAAGAAGAAEGAAGAGILGTVGIAALGAAAAAAAGYLLYHSVQGHTVSQVRNSDPTYKGRVGPTGAVPPATHQLTSATFATMTHDVTQWSAQTLGAMGHWAAQAGHDITHWAQHAGQTVAHWAQHTGTQVTRWAQQTQHDLQQWSTQAGGHLAHWASTTTTRLGMWAKHGETTISSWASQTSGQVQKWAQDVSRWFTDLFSGISGLLHTLASSGGKDLKSAGSLFGNLFKTVTTSVGTLWQAVTGGSGGLPAASHTLPALSVKGLVTRWNPDVTQAIHHLGSHASPLLTTALVDAIMQQQSGGLNSLNGKPTIYHDSNGTADYGLMQINSSNFNSLGLTAQSALNPQKNIQAAVSMLNGLLQTYGNVKTAAYHYAGSGPQATADAQQVVSTMALNQHALRTGTRPTTPAVTHVHVGGITVQAGHTSDPKKLATQVASELVQQMKRHGNLVVGV